MTSKRRHFIACQVDATSRTVVYIGVRVTATGRVRQTAGHRTFPHRRNMRYLAALSHPIPPDQGGD